MGPGYLGPDRGAATALNRKEVMMVRLRRGKVFVWWALVIVLVAPGAFPAWAADAPAGGNRTVTGDVLNIENNVVTVKEISGHEVEVKLTPQTKQEDRIKVGDKVEAQLDSNGQAQSIRVKIP